MRIDIKTFDELTKHEVYEILRLRSEVFVVEQDCAYQDIDGKDQKAHHALGKKKGGLVAYTRIFNSGDYFDQPSIGRVVVQKNHRKQGLARQIMKVSMAFVAQKMKGRTIELSAQTYLTKFYQELGFQNKGKEYLEDGIPHIKMEYQIKF